MRSRTIGAASVPGCLFQLSLFPVCTYRPIKSEARYGRRPLQPYVPQGHQRHAVGVSRCGELGKGCRDSGSKHQDSPAARPSALTVLRGLWSDISFFL